MNILKPSYFDKFVCIASKCSDTCCKGWKIPIDNETYKKYISYPNKNLKGIIENGIEIVSNENDKESIFFKVIDNKCTFLNKDNLCDIYINLGYDYMCGICREYPRVYNMVNGTVEKSILPTCIEGARLILFEKNPIRFELENNTDDNLNISIHHSIDSKNTDNIIEKCFEEINLFCIKIIQTRILSIEDRLIILGLFFNSLEKCITENDIYTTIISYENNVKNGVYNNISYSMNDNIESEKVINVIKNIFNAIIVKDISYLRYIENLEDIFNYGMSYYYNFIKDKYYIYENYFTNYIFLKTLPYPKISIMENYAGMVIHFIIFKYLIAGLCFDLKDNINVEDILELIQKISKHLFHSTGYDDRVKYYVESNKKDTILYLLMMIGK